MEADPINIEMGEGDLNHVEDTCEGVGYKDFYVGRIFHTENVTYDAYNIYASAKGFGARKGKTNNLGQINI